MNDNQRREALRKFIGDWKERGSEKSDAALFWLGLLTALGLENPLNSVRLEHEVDVDGHACFIDVLIPSTRVLIEQKSRGIDLEKPARQSDGSFLTPFEQAKRYVEALPYSQRPRWIVTCNFDEFRVYDLDRLPVLRTREAVKPQIVTLKHLLLEYNRLMFLADPNDENIEEVKISADAVRIIEKIRRAFARKMIAASKISRDPIKQLTREQLDELNQFCVRLVFCLYAEDAALFAPNQFVDYIKNAADQTQALAELFQVLSTPKPQRPKGLRAELDAFPYVDGGLFDKDSITIPAFDKITSDIITLYANDDKINWFAINPTIFGALFESNLSSDTRRSGGMHFTSRANIHKLIDPLFLDDLHDEFDAIKRKRKVNRLDALKTFHDKIASLTFFDPACGSGNFLTETYISLRELENDVLRELLKFGADCTVKVSIEQFFGIEIDSFACAIAQTAMWISESKMYYDTEIGIREKVKQLPLIHSAHITCGNALRRDWKKLVPRKVDYIIGNPPFSGARYMSKKNKTDLLHVFKGWTHPENLDFVACWFKRAADFMIGTKTRAAFVATNSICQGESIGLLWSKLFETIHIDFAHRTFRWTSESEEPAVVHCVIIGFSHAPNKRPKLIIDGEKKIRARNINAYLLDAPDFFVKGRSHAICNVPPMKNGNMPRDDGNLIIEAEDYDLFIQQEPRAEKYIRRLVGADEFIKGNRRWCLWLKHATADEIKSMPLVSKRVEAVRKFRLHSRAKTTRGYAKVPQLFAQPTQPEGKSYIIVPRVSASSRRYIPMGFLTPDVIATDAVQIIPDGELYHFGVLTSSVHMAWMRIVCGRFGTGYRYSKEIVYNNFPWCTPTIDQRAAIERSAQAILDARTKFPDRPLASLYDESTMPSELRAAHQENDNAVLDAYGFARDMSESEIVTRLMVMYQQLTETVAHE